MVTVWRMARYGHGMADAKSIMGGGLFAFFVLSVGLRSDPIIGVFLVVFVGIPLLIGTFLIFCLCGIDVLTWDHLRFEGTRSTPVSGSTVNWEHHALVLVSK